MYLLRGEIKQLVVQWCGTLVKNFHRYGNFDRLNCYRGHLVQWWSGYSAFQTRYILQTIRTTTRNGQYIPILETLTWRLDQSLQILEESLLPFCRFLWNMTLKLMEKHWLWRINESMIRRMSGMSSSWYFILWMCLSTMESWCSLRMVSCSNV